MHNTEIQKSNSGHQRSGEIKKLVTRKALLISTAYEPVSFIGYRRMISLLRRGVVEVLADWQDDTITKGIQTPAVLKLKNFVLASTAHKMCAYNRGVVFARDQYICQYCGKELNYSSATVDHVIPRSRGGQNHWYNCVTSCKTCNGKKSDYTLEEIKMSLIKKPNQPMVAHFWMANMRRSPSSSEWHQMWSDLISQ